MLFGKYEHTLDEKNRLAIPSRLRNELGEKVYILKGFDGCLSVYKEDRFSKLMNDISSLPFNKKDSRDFIRLQLSTTFDIGVDKVGRLQIPAPLINQFKIGKEVTIIGVGDHIEIWDREIYNEYEKKASTEFESLAERIGNSND